MIPAETPYKVLKYLFKLAETESLQKKYDSETIILHWIERNYLNERSGRFVKTPRFTEPFDRDIAPAIHRYGDFIEKYQIENLENHYSIGEFEGLIKIENEKGEILKEEFTLQSLLTRYFGSSKFRKADSIFAEAIKKILSIDSFPEEDKDQQFLSILYPKEQTRFIILCENRNRLVTTRYNFIEFWYAGGKNTKQLQFIPKPTCPIFYLFDWDYDGINIYTLIKKKYFPNISSIIPRDFETLMKKQSEVKDHHSKWQNDNCFQYLSETERAIANKLYKTDCIIEEQSILLSKENLLFNNISA